MQTDNTNTITVGDWYPNPYYPYYPTYPSYPTYTPPATVHITTNWPSAAEIAQQKAWEAMEAYYKKLTEQLEASDMAGEDT